MSLTDWSRILIALDQLPDALLRLAQVETDTKGLQSRMATEEETTARIDQVTNNMASDIATIRQTLTDLRTAVNSGNTAAIASAMDRVSTHITTLEQAENTLRGLPSETAPTPAPTASGTPTSAPATGASTPTPTPDTTGATPTTPDTTAPAAGTDTTATPAPAQAAGTAGGTT